MKTPQGAPGHPCHASEGAACPPGHQTPAAAPTSPLRGNWARDRVGYGLSILSLSLPRQLPLPTPLTRLHLAPCGTLAGCPREPEPGQEHSQLSQPRIRTTNKHCCLETPPLPSIPGRAEAWPGARDARWPPSPVQPFHFSDGKTEAHRVTESGRVFLKFSQ